MKWWKKALLGSLILIVLTATGAALLIQRAQSGAENASHASAWIDKIAEVSGAACGVGIVLVWAVFFARHNLEKERLAEAEEARANRNSEAPPEP